MKEQDEDPLYATEAPWDTSDGLSPASKPAPVQENKPDEPSPNDISLATLTMLMRIYDVNMRILDAVGEDNDAKELWELHAAGKSESPPIYLIGE